MTCSPSLMNISALHRSISILMLSLPFLSLTRMVLYTAVTRARELLILESSGIICFRYSKK